MRLLRSEVLQTAYVLAQQQQNYHVTFLDKIMIIWSTVNQITNFTTFRSIYAVNVSRKHLHKLGNMCLKTVMLFNHTLKVQNKTPII